MLKNVLMTYTMYNFELGKGILEAIEELAPSDEAMFKGMFKG